MIIIPLVVGVIETNCYIVADEKSKEAMIIDPGDNAPLILKALKQADLKPNAIVITHGHFDHMGGNKVLKEKLGTPILMHENDKFGLTTTDSPPPDRWLQDGEILTIGELAFKVIHNPGHSPGSLSLYCEGEKTLFSGDTLFFGTYGRVDLPLSSEEAMHLSLQKLLKLPGDTKVYPGHGRSTTIQAEQDLLEAF